MKSIDDESSDILPTEPTSKNSLLKNGFWATYGAFATRFLALANNLLLARLLLPSEFGVIGVAYIFWSFVNLFAQDTAASFIVYKGIKDKRYLNTTYTISLGIGLILAVGLIATSPLIAKFFGIPDLIWLLTGFAFNLVLSFYQSVYVGVLRSQMRFQSLTNLTLVASMARVFSTVVSALLGLSYWSFLIGDMISWVIASILARREVKYNFQLQIDKEVCSEVLSYSLGGTGYSLGYYVNANSDNFVVGKLLGTTSLGYYNLAYQLTMALPVILSQVVNQIGMSAFTQMTDDKQQENALKNVIEQIAVFITPIYALFFLIIDKQAISLIFGEKWTPVAALIPWLLVFAYFRVVNSAISSMLQAKGRPGVNAKVNLIIAPIAVIGFVIGSIQGKIIGVSISVAIILGIGWTFYWWSVGCKALKWSMIKILQPSFLPIFFTVILMICFSYLPIIIKPIIFAIAYLIVMRRFQPIYFRKIQDFADKGFLLIRRKINL
nr:oligosaccharide flippase family protein [Hassalia byssoidea]